VQLVAGLLRFWFRCPECGGYPVKGCILSKFIPRDKWGGIQKDLREGAIGVVIQFEDCCPNCEPKDGSSHGTIRVLWPKKQRE